MGSVIDCIDCPHCKHEATLDFYYKTGEEEIVCFNCGYRRSTYIMNRDKALNELTDEDWVVAEIKNPYASSRLKMKGEIGTQCTSIETEEQYDEFVDFVSSMKSDIEYASTSRFVDGEIKEEILVNEKNK